MTSGGLAASVQTKSDRTTATIGRNKIYATTHQFGGVTSARSMNPGKTTPAHPDLPFNPSTRQLAPEAEQEVQDRITDWAAELGFKWSATRRFSIGNTISAPVPFFSLSVSQNFD